MDKKEKEFNTILDECLDRLLFKGDTPEQCLNDYPDLADELRPLLETSILTSQVTELTPDPEFRNQARNEIVAILNQAQENRNRAWWTVFGLHRRLAFVMTAIILVFGAGGGLAAASANVMPDSYLYPVKRATEEVQLAFTFTSLGKAEAYTRIADERVEEIVYMANQSDPDEVFLLSADLDSNLMSIAALSSQQSTNSAILTEKSGAAFMESAQMAGDMVTTSEAIGADSNDGESYGESSADENADISIMEEDDSTDNTTNDAGGMLAIVPAVPGVSIDPVTPIRITEEDLTPEQQLNVTVVNQAATNISKLYELLETAPESARAAIEYAIKVSENGYRIAIDSLK